MKQMVLGVTGSGKSRYLYSVIKNEIKKSNSVLVFSEDLDSINLNRYLNLSEVNNDTNVTVRFINDFNLRWKDLLEIIKQESISQNYDTIIIQREVLSKNVELNFSDLDNYKVYFSAQLNKHINADIVNKINLDTTVPQFDKVIYLSNDKGHVTVKESNVVDEKLVGLNEGKVYSPDALKNCEFDLN